MGKSRKRDVGARSGGRLAGTLPVIRPLVAGLDVGSKEHWVCGPAKADGTPNVRVFGTTTSQLGELADWLLEQGVESVAMESTSVYWIPVYELLESRGLEVVLVNARQLHNVPGRKTDFDDCQWRAMKARGDHQARTSLWRFAGADLTRIDGIRADTARIVPTELGSDVTPFPAEDNFVSWLRLSPRTPISGGKPLRKRRNGLGANRVAGALRMAALSLQRSKSALGAYFRRIARRKGVMVAICVTARQLARLIYRMLRYGQDYVDVGEKAFELRFQSRRLEALTRAAHRLGYTLTPTQLPSSS